MKASLTAVLICAQLSASAVSMRWRSFPPLRFELKVRNFL